MIICRYVLYDWGLMKVGKKCVEKDVEEKEEWLRSDHSQKNGVEVLEDDTVPFIL